MKLAELKEWAQRHAAKAIPLAVVALSLVMGGPIAPTAQAANPQTPRIEFASTPSTAASAPVGVAQGGSDAIVYLNEATITELVGLPGIGPKRAQALLELRDKRGGKFRSVDEIVRVKGIGPKMLARLKPRLALARPGLATAQETANTAMATKSATK